jgi:addiction module RelE/StbE family toxin
MEWKVISTDTFSRQFQKHKKDGEFVNALDKKIKRLAEDPENVGGYLSGKLHGYKSTRIIKKFRLVFKIVKERQEVYLMAIDHRKFDYEGFNFD